MSKETKALTINPQLAAFQEELLKNYDKANLSAKKGQTLFVGSSLMEIFPIEKWEEAGEVTFSHYIYNRAVRATTTSFLLEHIESQIFNLEPSKIFINIGTNDIGFEIPEEEFLNNYEGEKMENNSGITSLAGYAYQIKVFVYYSFLLNDNFEVSYDGRIMEF